MKREREGPRVIMRVDLTVEAQKRLTTTVEEFGLKQVTVSSRMLAWAARQDDVTQAMILGLYPVEDQDAITERVMKKMAKGY